MNNPILYFLSGMLYSGNWFGNLSKVKHHWHLKVRVKIYVCVNFRDSFPTFDFSWCLSSRDSCCQFKTLKWAKKFLRTFQSWLRSAATRISDSDQLLISASARILNSPSVQSLAQPSKQKCQFCFTENHPMSTPKYQNSHKNDHKCHLVVCWWPCSPPNAVSQVPRGRGGHKRTDMTQPMFWMSTILSKRLSTMELIRPKSKVFYILDIIHHLPNCRCMTQMLLNTRCAQNHPQVQISTSKNLSETFQWVWTIGHLVSILYESELFPTEQDVGR